MVAPTGAVSTVQVPTRLVDGGVLAANGVGALKTYGLNPVRHP